MRTEYLVDENGCWIWQMCRNNRGYGLKWDPATRRLMVAHRWYYERSRGPIPRGMQIDHLCNVEACVNVAHLEAVTPQVNSKRVQASVRIAGEGTRPGPRATPGPHGGSCRVQIVERVSRSGWLWREVGQRQAGDGASVGIRAGIRTDSTRNAD
jgi:hypothetical protein